VWARGAAACAGRAVRRRVARLSTGSRAAAAAACAAMRGLVKSVEPQPPAGDRANSTAGRAAVARPPVAPSAPRDNGGTIHVAVRGHSTGCRTVNTPGSPDQPSPGDDRGHATWMGHLQGCVCAQARNRIATQSHRAYPQFPQPYPQRVTASTQALSGSRSITVDNTMLSSHTDRQPGVDSSEWVAARRPGDEPRPHPVFVPEIFQAVRQEVMISITAVTHLTGVGWMCR
jgi:hypothetical protein